MAARKSRVRIPASNLLGEAVCEGAQLIVRPLLLRRELADELRSGLVAGVLASAEDKCLLVPRQRRSDPDLPIAEAPTVEGIDADEEAPIAAELRSASGGFRGGVSGSGVMLVGLVD